MKRTESHQELIAGLTDDVRGELSSGGSRSTIMSELLKAGLSTEDAEAILRAAARPIGYPETNLSDTSNRKRILVGVGFLGVGLTLYVVQILVDFYPLLLATGLAVIAGVERLSGPIRHAIRTRCSSSDV